MKISIDEEQNEIRYEKEDEVKIFGLDSNEALNIQSKQWVKLVWNKLILGKDWDSEEAQNRRQQLNNGKGGVEPELVAFFYALRIIFPNIWVRALISNYIGHLALNTELYFRRDSLVKRDIIDNSTMRILYCPQYGLANQQLYNMIKRRANEYILESPYIFAVLRMLAQDNPGFIDMGRTKSVYFADYELHYLDTDVVEWNEIPPQLNFTDDEKHKGMQLLNQMGVEQNTYICMHSRDQKYTEARYEDGLAKYAFRNCDIENYLGAAEYMAKQGTHILRMGEMCEKKLQLTNPKIIDYSKLYRTDFGDIYLPTKCKFFLGCPSGIAVISTIFGIPIAMANVVRIDTPCFLESDIYIYKKFWSKKQHKFLSFPEILELGADKWSTAEDFENAGINLVENTVEEILDLAMEMNQKIDGTWVASPEDDELQQRYRDTFPVGHPVNVSRSRIGMKFLKDNMYLLK